LVVTGAGVATIGVVGFVGGNANPVVFGTGVCVLVLAVVELVARGTIGV